ncbi:hypothetical protein [Streptomyces sp. NBC_01136]|uniref:hypothetical protein n=1 Tax=Streptomyces sp. NBC_01136 TaxID=2903754 RepID=UPI003862E056
MILTVENDGVPDAGPGPAEPVRESGLPGLRERLRGVDGVLRAGPVGGGLVPHPASEVTP